MVQAVAAVDDAGVEHRRCAAVSYEFRVMSCEWSRRLGSGGRYPPLAPPYKGGGLSGGGFGRRIALASHAGKLAIWPCSVNDRSGGVQRTGNPEVAHGTRRRALLALRESLACARGSDGEFAGGTPRPPRRSARATQRLPMAPGAGRCPRCANRSLALAARTARLRAGRPGHPGADPPHALRCDSC